jgi:CRISPR-associated protein (TIGR02710 family)
MAAAFRADAPNRHTQIIAVPADDPDVGFDRIIAAIESTARRRPGHRLIANYTGGTKSMSGALLMAAFHRRLEVQITTGARPDLTKVLSGTESARHLDTRLMGVEADLATALTLAEGGDYAGSAFLLERLQGEVNRKGLRPSKDLRRRLETGVKWSRCLAAWDVFNHREAHRMLQGGWEAGETWVEALDASGHRGRLNDIVASGRTPSLALCEDLLANARRRRDQQRHDDALARLYRFTEACAQTQLFKRWGLKSGELIETDLPDALKGRSTIRYDPRLKRPVHQIALHQTMQLLIHRDALDPVARVYFDVGDHGPAWLGARHKSILAHGFQVIDKTLVDEALAWVDTKLAPALGLSRPPPLPTRPFANISRISIEVLPTSATSL